MPLVLLLPSCCDLYWVDEHPVCWARRKMMHLPLERCFVREFLKANFWLQCEQAYLGGWEGEKREGEACFSEALA